MNKAHVVFDRRYVTGEIDRRIAGSFVEHLGRCLYSGLYEPDHPAADAAGFRNDVKALIRELGVTAVRYPGGNFVSGYNWKDGIGPRDKRPVRKDMAWNVLETNHVGINEFAAYLKEIGVELIQAVNLGTGSPMEAGELVDYCNGSGGSYWSDLRKSHGPAEPHNIRLWCLGNEMDGFWQIGALTAEEYGRKAREAAKIMRWMDNKIKLIACGSCTNEAGHTSFGEWDRIVLEEAYDHIDYLSLHKYFNYRPDKHLAYPMHDDARDIPFLFRDLQDYLDTVIAACDFVKGKKRSGKEVHISFDEWGVITETGAVPGGREQHYGFANFNLMDAVICGGILCTLINNADRVKAACQSLLVNEGGMISTAPGGKAIRQTTFFPFKDAAHLAKGMALRPVASLPRGPTAHHGEQETMTAAGTFDEERGKLRVFVMNCDTEQDCGFSLELGSFEKLQGVSHTLLYDDDIKAANTFEHENRVLPQSRALASPEKNRITVIIPKHSWNVLEFDAE